MKLVENASLLIAEFINFEMGSQNLIRSVSLIEKQIKDCVEGFNNFSCKKNFQFNLQHEKFMGKGANGTVYRMYEPTTGKTYACKSILKEKDESILHFYARILKELEMILRITLKFPGEFLTVYRCEFEPKIGLSFATDCGIGNLYEVCKFLGEKLPREERRLVYDRF